MKTISEEISGLVGAENDWQDYVVALVKRKAVALRPNALIDDIVTDVTSNLILDLRAGKLDKALGAAGGRLADVKGVIAAAVNFRTRAILTQARQFYKPVAELHDEVFTPGYESDDTEQYKMLLTKELESMADEWKLNASRAKRLRLASRIVPSRVDGGKIVELMTKFDVKSKATMQDIINDIQSALRRVAVKVGDETLIHGMTRLAA